MKDLVENKNYVKLIQNIENIIADAKGEIATTVNQVIVQTYWSIGRHIVE